MNPDWLASIIDQSSLDDIQARLPAREVQPRARIVSIEQEIADTITDIETYLAQHTETE